MVKNVGSTDKIARYAIAVVAVIAALLVGGTLLKVVLFLVAAIMVGTAVMGFCPIWLAAKVNTNKPSQG